MARPTGDIADRVAQRARGIDAFVRKLELLYQNRTTPPRLTRTDLERAYSGAFLSFISFFENAWEDLFFGLLMERLEHPQPVQPLVSIRSAAVARGVVIGEARNYLDWLPASRSVDRAKLYLSQGRPFSDMSNGDKATVKRYMTIRNALAHDSKFAIERFKKEVIQQRALPPAERRPAGYLRGVHAVGQTRMNLALAEMSVVMRRLCS